MKRFLGFLIGRRNVETRLEYGFYLATCNLSNRTRTFPNPFTGKPATVPIDEGLCADECDSLRDVIRSAGFTKSEIPGEGYELQMSPEERIRLRGEVEVGRTGCPVEILTDCLTDRMFDLVLSVARAGNFALMSGMGDRVRLPNAPATELVAARWPNAPMIYSRDDLKEWLEKVIGSRSVTIQLL